MKPENQPYNVINPLLRFAPKFGKAGTARGSKPTTPSLSPASPKDVSIRIRFLEDIRERIAIAKISKGL